jgi:hypothetical protein
MIKSSEIYKHFKVRDMNTGRLVSVLGGDSRYAPAGTGLFYNYRQDPAGEYILVELCPESRGGYLLRPEDAEAVVGGQYHPDHISGLMALSLSMTYEGSWRQFADQQAKVA